MTSQLRKPALILGALCALTPSLLGQTFQDGQGIIYAYGDDRTTCYVQGHSDDLAATLAIPSLINGMPVTHIGDGAFFGCRDLTAIAFGDSIRHIGYGAFYGCSALQAIALPPATRRIKAYAFAACPALAALDLGTGLSAIAEDAFASCSALTDLTLPAGLDSVAFRAFADCASLASVSIGAGTRFIDSYAFAGCPQLAQFSVSADNPVYHDLDGNLIHSASNTLLAAAHTATLTVPQGIQHVREALRYGAAELTDLVLPDGVADIDLFAFADCPQLQSVTTYALRPYPIDDAVFQTYDDATEPARSTYADATLYVPVGTRSAYEATAGWNLFRHIVEFDPMCIEDTPFGDARHTSPALYFSPDGYRRPRPAQGVNIIRLEDGSVKKVFLTE